MQVQRTSDVHRTGVPVETMPYRQLHLIRFDPFGKSAAVSSGASLLDAARRAGIELAANCCGQGDCGECCVIMLEGEVSALCDEERNCLTPEQIQAGWRLACCARIHGPARVMVPEIPRKAP